MVTHCVPSVKVPQPAPTIADITGQPIGYVYYEPALANLTNDTHICSYCGAVKSPLGEHPAETLCLLDESGASHGLCETCSELWPNKLTPLIAAMTLRRRKLRAYIARLRVPAEPDAQLLGL